MSKQFSKIVSFTCSILFVSICMILYHKQLFENKHNSELANAMSNEVIIASVMVASPSEAAEYCYSIDEPIPIEVNTIVGAIVIPKINNYIYYNIDLSDELQEFTQEVCELYGVNYELMLGFMYVESRFKEGLLSKTQDYGLLQINKYNHKWIAEKTGITDFLDSKSSIVAGAVLIKECMRYSKTDAGIAMCYHNLSEALSNFKNGIYSNSYSDKVVAAKNSFRRRVV